MAKKASIKIQTLSYKSAGHYSARTPVEISEPFMVTFRQNSVKKLLRCKASVSETKLSDYLTWGLYPGQAPASCFEWR